MIDETSSTAEAENSVLKQCIDSSIELLTELRKDKNQNPIWNL